MVSEGQDPNRIPCNDVYHRPSPGRSSYPETTQKPPVVSFSRVGTGPWATHTLEALAADAYRQGVFSSAEVQRFLGLPSRFDVAHFLKRAGVPVSYGEAELEADRRTWHELGQG